MEIKRTLTVTFDEQELDLLVLLMDYIDNCQEHLNQFEVNESMSLKTRIQTNFGKGARDVDGSLLKLVLEFDPNDEIPF